VPRAVDVAGAVIFIARGKGFILPGAVAPPKVVFIPGENDPDIGPARVQPFVGAVTTLGGEAVMWINHEVPLTPDMLSRLPGVSCPQSYQLTEALEAAGILDAAGEFLIAPTPAMAADVPQPFAESAQVIVDLLIETHGGHMVTEEFDADWLDLMLAP
jgi:hypothetical protein